MAVLRQQIDFLRCFFAFSQFESTGIVVTVRKSYTLKYYISKNDRAVYDGILCVFALRRKFVMVNAFFHL